MTKYLSFIFLLIFLQHVPVAYSSQMNDMLSLENNIQDAVITTKITAWYAKNTNLNPLKIFVSTQDGIVTISGFVEDKNAYIDALRIAKSTDGVKGINADELEIKKVNTLFADAYITAKVETAVLKAKVLDDESIPLVGINASTENGVVTITGTMPSEKAITALIKRVSNITGVKKIVSHLTVNEQ